MAARRVQSYLLRRYDWRPRVYASFHGIPSTDRRILDEAEKPPDEAGPLRNSGGKICITNPKVDQHDKKGLLKQVTPE